MTDEQKAAINKLAYRANEICALCGDMAIAFKDDPDTSDAGWAIDGVQTLALMLSNDMLALTQD